MDEKLSPDWNHFAEQDPFNHNFVEGWISHHHGDEYGAIRIDKVNEFLLKVRKEIW